VSKEKESERERIRNIGGVERKEKKRREYSIHERKVINHDSEAFSSYPDFKF
jgi:hypothetical protein